MHVWCGVFNYPKELMIDYLCSGIPLSEMKLS